MAITLVATAGSASANTYSSLAEANGYIETTLHNSDWNNASDDEKKAALVWATRLLDQYINWYGYRATETQALRIPMVWSVTDPDGYSIDDATIPQFVINATAELAKHLIIKDRTLDPGTMGFTYMKVGSLELKTDKHDMPEIIPEAVFGMLKLYGEKRKSTSNKLVRV